MTYFTQMVGLTVHNFLSAAAGIAVLMAVISGFTRHSVQTTGQFLGGYDTERALYLNPAVIVIGGRFDVAGRGANIEQI